MVSFHTFFPSAWANCLFYLLLSFICKNAFGRLF